MAVEPKIITKPRSKLAEPADKEALENLFLSSPEAETPDDIAIDNLLNDFKSTESAEVRINRVMPNNKLSYIATVHPSEFRFDDLRDVYEGGQFRLFVYGVDEEGRKQLRSAKQISVEKPRQVITPVIQQQNQSSDVAAIMAQSMNGLGTLLVQGFENLGKLIVQNQAPQKTTLDMLTEMKMMKDVFSPAQTVTPVVESQDSVTKALDMLQKGIDLGKGIGEVRGETSSSDLLMEALKSFAPLVAAGVANQPQAAQPQIHPQNLAPVIPPVPLAQNQPTETEDMNFIKRQQLKMGLHYLVEQAKIKSDTSLYAELTLDNLSDDDIANIFSLDDPLKPFIEIEPEINNHLEWFRALIVDCEKLLTSDEVTTDNQDINNSGNVIENGQIVNEVNNTDQLNTVSNT